MWNDLTNETPHSYNFNDRRSGIQMRTLANSSREVEFFEYFMNVDLVSKIIEQTHLYKNQFITKNPLTPSSRVHKWYDLCTKEFYVFLALIMLMGCDIKAELPYYWSRIREPQTPIFRKHMARDRFQIILKFLHFCNNDELMPDKGPFQKMRLILDDFKEKCKQLVEPYQKLCIDESLTLYKGRLSIRQYIQTKRSRFGIKSFVLCDCRTGLILDLIEYAGLYTNIDRSDKMGFGAAVVKKLMEPYLNSNRIIYADNYYSSPKLCNYLSQQGTGYCGTVRASRKCMPKFKKIKKGEIIQKVSKGIFCIKWCDKRDVLMLSTIHKGNLIATNKKDRTTGNPLKKPDAVVDYNLNMRIIDQVDMFTSMVSCMRKSKKWYIKYFFHMMDLMLVNAFRSFKLCTGTHVTYRIFIEKVAMQLLEENSSPKRKKRDINAANSVNRELIIREFLNEHYIEPVEGGENGKQWSKMCRVCNKPDENGAPPRKRRRVLTQCGGCKVPLCAQPCWADYHKAGNYRCSMH